MVWSLQSPLLCWFLHACDFDTDWMDGWIYGWEEGSNFLLDTSGIHLDEPVVEGPGNPSPRSPSITSAPSATGFHPMIDRPMRGSTHRRVSLCAPIPGCGRADQSSASLWYAAGEALHVRVQVAGGWGWGLSAGSHDGTGNYPAHPSIQTDRCSAPYDGGCLVQDGSVPRRG